MLVQYQLTKYSEEYTIILHPRASAQEVVATGLDQDSTRLLSKPR
jgi:hypothetical protein